MKQVKFAGLKKGMVLERTISDHNEHYTIIVLEKNSDLVKCLVILFGPEKKNRIKQVEYPRAVWNKSVIYGQAWALEPEKDDKFTKSAIIRVLRYDVH